MAEIDKKLSEFTTAEGNLTANDLELVAVADQQSATGYSSRKITAINKAQDYLNTFLFPLLLNTTNKSIIGAINELAAGGGGGTASILTGTTAPTSAQGSDGNLYVQYTAGTGGASDVVDAFFVKLDGEWIEISTGGGTGGTGKKLTGTLTAGTTSVTFSDSAITTTSLIDVYTETGISPSSYTVSTGSLSLTFASQQADVGIAVLIDARGSGSGGSQVSITPSISSGNKIADYEIDGVSGSLYAPNTKSFEIVLNNGSYSLASGVNISTIASEIAQGINYKCTITDARNRVTYEGVYVGITVVNRTGGYLVFQYISDTPSIIILVIGTNGNISKFTGTLS